MLHMTEKSGASKAHISNQPAQPRDRWAYGWLALGMLASLFAANGPWDIALAAWLAPFFLLRFLRTGSLRRGLIGIWLASVVTTIFWLYTSNFYDPHLFSPVNLFIFIIFLASHTLLVVPYLLDRLLTPRLARVSGLLATLVFPLGVVACEYINALWVPYGYFFSLGSTQYGDLPLLQIAAVTGIYGVSFLVAWVASVSNWIWQQHFSWPRIRVTAIISLGILALVLVSGSIRLLAFPPSSPTVRVAGVSVPKATYQQAMQRIASQAHPDRTFLHATYTSVENALLDVTQREAQAGAKIVSWPEIEVSTLPEDEAALVARGQALADQEHIYLEMAYRVVALDGTPLHNRAVLIDAQGQVVWTYDKAHPALGADPSIPGDGVMPVVDTPYGRLANVICLDAWYPGLMHQADNRGVDIMLVPGQEWTGSAGESLNWASQETAIRAIEYGYSLVRQATGDVAIIVDDQGRVLATSDYQQTDQQTMIASVPVKGTWTIYGLVSDLFAWLCLASLCLLMAWMAVLAFRSRSNHLAVNA